MSKKCFTPSQLNCKLSVWVLIPPYTKVRCWKSRSSEARLISSTVINSVYGGIYSHYDSLQFSCDGVKHFFDSPTVKQLYSYLSPLSIPVCRLHLGKADTLALIFHCELVTFCKQEYIFYIIIF